MWKHFSQCSQSTRRSAISMLTKRAYAPHPLKYKPGCARFAPRERKSGEGGMIDDPDISYTSRLEIPSYRPTTSRNGPLSASKWGKKL
jgi:hypothetical protein